MNADKAQMKFNLCQLVTRIFEEGLLAELIYFPNITLTFWHACTIFSRLIPSQILATAMLLRTIASK